MKNHIFKKYVFIFGLLLLAGLYGCQTEPLDAENNLSTSINSSSVKPEKNFDFESCDDATSDPVNLYAGQNMLVGQVTVSEDGVTFEITEPGWCISETHLSVVDSQSDFPINSGGNPKIGNFEYQMSHDCVQSYTYPIEVDSGSYIAAHAVVNCISDVDNESYEITLPSQVGVCVTTKGEPDSYFDIEIAPENSLTGSYEAWCLDQDATLNNLDCFTGDVYSSYGSLPDGKFEKPENFGALNWLMNQGFIGTEATPELGNYTFGDIQIAIWKLVDDSVCTVCEYTGPFNDDRVNMLVAMAMENNDFVPECGENLVIVIVPNDNKQSIFITIPVPCDECEETAWAAGCDFPGNNWATYFQYELLD